MKDGFSSQSGQNVCLSCHLQEYHDECSMGQEREAQAFHPFSASPLCSLELEFPLRVMFADVFCRMLPSVCLSFPDVVINILEDRFS